MDQIAIGVSHFLCRLIAYIDIGNFYSAVCSSPRSSGYSTMFILLGTVVVIFSIFGIRGRISSR